MSLDMFRLEGQCALVTGASRGLGREMALALALAGAEVVVTSRHGAEAQRVADEITALGRRALAIEADVSSAAAVRSMISASEGHFGKIDVLVNNAGVGHLKPALELSEAEFDELIGINLKGCFLAARAAAPGMISRGYGRIINVGSILSEVSVPGLAHYIASKHGLLGLTRSLALEWASAGVTVNCLCPGFFETAMTKGIKEDPAADESVRSRTPVGRWGQIEDLDGPIVFLASRASRFVTGTALYVDGGWTAQ